MSYNFQWNVIWQYKGLFVNGIFNTLSVSVITILLSAVIGLFVGLGRISTRRIFRVASTCYVEIVRNTPLLIQLFFIYFGLAQIGLIIAPFLCIVIALTFHYASYAGEILRANILSIGRGQGEAALALGMTTTQANMRIILPQAIHRGVPALGNQLVYLVKDSSLMAFFGMHDIMYAGTRIQVETWRVFEGYVIIGIIYLVLSTILTIGLKSLEAKMAIE